MHTAYDHAQEQLRVLLKLHQELPNAQALHEAQTRFLFVDALLFDCLGWEKTDCSVEERIDNQISDYTFSAPKRVFIVEAKRSGTMFELPVSVHPQRLWRIQAFKKDHPAIYDAIAQAVSYTSQRGTPFGAVTNGHQIIAFLGSRTDGIEPLAGKAVVFSSISEMLADFKAFWDLLSKPGITQRRLQVILQADGVIPPPTKLSAELPHYPGLKRRNKLQVQLSTISDYLFDDLLTTHGETEFLRSCYCKSGPLAEYAAVSKNILRARYSQVFEQVVGGPQLEPAVTTKGTAPELIHAPPGRPLLLLGDVGVGKSLFLNHFINVDAADMTSSTLFIYINLLRLPTLRVSSLWDHVLSEVKEQLANQHGIDVDEDDRVRQVYFRELERFGRTPEGRLKDVDDAEYEKQRAKFLRKYTDDDTKHMRSSMRAIQSGTRRQVTLVLDNIDHHVPEFQEEVFRIAEHIADAWGITVFLAMRPSTFYQSKKRGVIAAYQPRAFTVSPPRVADVIERRMSYIEKLVDEGTDGVLEQIRAVVPSLRDYLRVIVRSFQTNGELIACIENMAGGNVRRALDYLKDFLGSGHVDTEDILQDKDSYMIARHQFLRAITFRDYEHYDPNVSDITNVFDISSKDGKEHFLLLIIVSQLDQWARMRPGEGFVEAGELFECLQDLGYQPDQIDFALERAISRGMVEGLGSDDAGSVSNRAMIRVTTIGGYYQRTLCRLFTYVDAMIVDVPIVDASYKDRIRWVEEIDDRLARALLFLEYLDRQWMPLATRGCVFDWPDVSAAICNDISSIRNRPRRDRKHHY